MPTSRVKAKPDPNRQPTLIGVSNKNATIGGNVFVQDETPVPVAVNPSTGAVKGESA